MFPEEFPQETLVREMQFFGNHLDVLDGVLELYPQLQNDIVIDPFIGCAMADSFHSLREIFWRNTKFLGIPTYTTLLSEVPF